MKAISTDYINFGDERIKKRLAAKSRKAEIECLLWTGSKARGGYGQFIIWYNKKSYNVRVHRVAYKVHAGDIPEGLCVLHRCDTPDCIEPTHLFLGTQQDNIRDMFSKGRFKGGQKKGYKATAEHCRKIGEANRRRGKERLTRKLDK